MKSSVKGTDKLVKRLLDAGKQGERMADAVVNTVADQMVLEAKKLAPADLGQIRQNIGKEKIGIARVQVFSNSPHSPYQEFGIGPQVSIPAAFSDLAARVRARKGGNFEAFVLSLTDWVRRHGMPVSAAYPIAKAILRRGLRPQPFFYPSFVTARRNLPILLKKGLQQVMKKA